MLNFEEFKEKIKGTLFMSNPEERRNVEILIQPVLKNNGLKLCGLTVRNLTKNVGTTLYLEPFFEDYKKGRNFEKIISKIEEIYRRENPDIDFDTSFIDEFSLCRDKISIRLISKEANKELLETVPYLNFGDLAICFSIVCEIPGIPGDGSFLINNGLFKRWNEKEEVTKEELFKIALASIEPNVEDILDAIREMLRARGQEMPPIPEDMKVPKMYVISNDKGILGAHVLASKEALGIAAEKIGSSFYILPSSIHELIAVPYREEIEEEVLQGRVKEVNCTTVDQVDYLSDSVYFFDKNKSELSNALTKEVMTIDI